MKSITLLILASLFIGCVDTLGSKHTFAKYVDRFVILTEPACLRFPKKNLEYPIFEEHILEINNPKYLNSCNDSSLIIFHLFPGDSVYLNDIKVYHGIDAGDSYYAIGYFLDDNNFKVKFEYHWSSYGDSIYKSIWDDNLTPKLRKVE